MENKNIILLKHHILGVKFTNSFYTNQTDNGDLSDYIIIDVTSRVERDKEFMNEHPSFAKDLSPFFIGPVTSSDVKLLIFSKYSGNVGRYTLVIMIMVSQIQLSLNGEKSFILKRSVLKI